MQQPYVMAFRKRLKKRGYTDVSIKILKDDEKKDFYLVTAVEPLAKTIVKAECSISFMCSSFRF